MRAGITGFGQVEYKKQYIEDVVSSAFLDQFCFAIGARWRSMALVGLDIKTQYIEDVVSIACLDVFFAISALIFTGFGLFSYSKAIH